MINLLKKKDLKSAKSYDYHRPPIRSEIVSIKKTLSLHCGEHPLSALMLP